MPSESFSRWQRSRAADLDEIEAAHGAIGGSRRGRRWATRQINHAYVVILTAHFQGYCRDLHSECLDALARVAAYDILRFVIGAGGIRGRLLDRGNPNPGNIGADFGRLGVAFGPKPWRTMHEMHNAKRNCRT